MVSDKPDTPEGPGLNPQSCDIDYSQSREWGHQRCLGHFQGGQEGHFQILGAQEGHPGVLLSSFTYIGLFSFVIPNTSIDE